MPDKPRFAATPRPARSAPRARDGEPRDVILGIDPGLRRTGYALLLPAGSGDRVTLREAGLIRLRPDTPLPARLLELERELVTLIETHRPAALACEELYAHYKHPRTAILMGHARGVILVVAARYGLEILSVAATNVKKLLTGSGRASKRQMQLAVAATLGLVRMPEPHDVADAIAIALCGHRLRVARAAARSNGATR